VKGEPERQRPEHYCEKRKKRSDCGRKKDKGRMWRTSGFDLQDDFLVRSFTLFLYSLLLVMYYLIDR